MNNKDNRHIIDILFVIALFCIFVLSAMFLISIGANIYSKTMSNMDSNFNSRTAVAYIIEKIHQSDKDNSVSVGEFDKDKAIIITNTINDIDYVTYIYEYNNYIMELNTRAELSLPRSAGSNVVKVNKFNISQPKDNLIYCNIIIENETYDFYINLHTGDVLYEQ